MDPRQDRHQNDNDPEDIQRRNEEAMNGIIYVDEESEEEAEEISNLIHDARQPTKAAMQQICENVQQSMNDYNEEITIMMETEFSHLTQHDPPPRTQYPSKPHAPSPTRIDHICVTSINLTSLE